MANGGSDSGSESGESAMADFVDAFEVDSDDGELPTIMPAPQPESALQPEPEPEPALQSGVREMQFERSDTLSETGIYAALRAVATDVASRQVRSAAELERLVKGLENWSSAGVQQHLRELCKDCVRELANARDNDSIVSERSIANDAQIGDGPSVEEEEDINRGVVRVLAAIVNCVDAARCEVDAGLLELLLELKGAVGVAANSVRSGGSSNAIWRFDKVRMIPLPIRPWPELVGASQCAGLSATAAPASNHPAQSEMHVDLQLLGGAEAMASIASALAAHGLCTCSGLLPPDSAAKARKELATASEHALFKTALKGGKAGATPRDDVVLWLDPGEVLHRSALPSLLDVEERLAQLGSGLARVLRVSPGGDAVPLSGRSGAMAACYRNDGAQYQPHIDNPCGLGGQPGQTPDDGRRLTAIWYPNEEDWDISRDGAALRVWTTSSKQNPFAHNPTAPGAGVVDVCPSGGTLALFWAHRTPHAVLPATGKRARYAISVWFNA
eukprot:COSAG02_NODE_8940_length_2392_cov_2.703009_1_plen_501_part_00